MRMSEDDALMMRKCVKNLYLLRIEIRICAYYAHIMYILCADAHDAQKLICANYAHIMRICAYHAHYMLRGA